MHILRRQKRLSFGCGYAALWLTLSGNVNQRGVVMLIDGVDVNMVVGLAVYRSWIL
jgi:hypothetical protein